MLGLAGNIVDDPINLHSKLVASLPASPLLQLMIRGPSLLNHACSPTTMLNIKKFNTIPKIHGGETVSYV